MYEHTRCEKAKLFSLFSVHQSFFDWLSIIWYNLCSISYVFFLRDILFPTELHFKNVYYLYSACSNPTDVVLLIVLSMIIGKSAWYW
jgi:hypothetical protein